MAVINNLKHVKYIFIAGIGAGINTMSFILIMINIGVTDSARNYLASIAIFSAINLMVMLIFEQFQIEYKKLKDKLNKNNFYISYVLTGLVLTSIMAIILNLIIVNDVFFKILMPGLDFENAEIVKEYLSYVLISSPFYLVHNLTVAKYAADKKISKSYYISYVPNIINMVGVAITFKYDLEYVWLILFLIIGYFSSSILFIYFLVKNNYKFNYDRLVLNVIKKSFYVRSVYNIHNIFINLVIANLTSSLNSSNASIYMYLKKIIDTILQVTVGPLNKIMMNKMHFILDKKRKDDYQNYIKSYKINVTVMLFGIILSLLGIIEIIKDVSIIKDNYIYTISYVILMILHGLLISMESPYSFVISWMNKFYVFIIANVFFISFFYIFKFLIFEEIKNYYLGLGFLFSQIAVYFIIKHFAQYYLKNYLK